MLMLFQSGISRVANSMVSVTSRMLSRGGKMNSFWAMYSLRMSFCSVPPSFARGMPRRSAAAMNIAQIAAAGPLIVIETVTSSSGTPSSRISMSAQRGHPDAALAELAGGDRFVGVVAHQRRQVEGHAQASLAVGEQVEGSARSSPRRCRSRRNWRIVHGLPR